MSIWDNVKKFAQPYNDDEYSEYDEDEEYMDDYEEEEEKPRRSFRSNRSSRRSAPAREPERERESAPVQESEDDYEEAFNSIPKAAPAAAPAASAAPTASGSFSGRVMNRNDARHNIVLFRPNSYNDAHNAGDELKQNHPVIVNLEGVDEKTSRRVVDFLGGCVFAMDGSVKKIAQSAYLFCPHNVEISGDLENLGVEVEQLV